jgi:hypothetical protein
MRNYPNLNEAITNALPTDFIVAVKWGDEVVNYILTDNPTATAEFVNPGTIEIRQTPSKPFGTSRHWNTCIRDGCGLRFDPSIPDDREGLRPFAKRYCPKHRIGTGDYQAVTEIKPLPSCPYCKGTDTQHITDWTATSNEPMDSNNTAVLEEYQCATCCNKSFWI